jgi:LuxR family transcriptional regulator of csgAB operon
MNKETPKAIEIISCDNVNAQALAALIQTSLATNCQNLSKLKIHTDTGYFILIDANDSIAASRTTVAKLHWAQPKLRAALFNVRPHTPQELLVEWPVVKGLFYQGDSTDTLMKGLRQLLNNSYWLPQRIYDNLLDTGRQPPAKNGTNTQLSRRELQVIEELNNGKTNKAIPKSLYISELTVKSHLYRIFKKIGAKNRAEVQRWAQENI